MNELTPEQKQFIAENWKNMDFISLVREAFHNKELNGRSKEAKLVQKFLGTGKTKKEKIATLELTGSQKEYIENTVDLMTPHEMAKIIFDNKDLKPISKEVDLINSYVKTLNKKEQFPHEDYAQEDYRPPDQISAVVAKVNKFLGKDINHKTMPTIQRKTMEAVRNFLNAPRFLQTINSYISQRNRDMFEQEFVRSVFDKPDLTPDELNIVITMCQLYNQQVTLHRHLDMLNIKYEENLNEQDGKISMALAEMVKAKSAELEKCNKAISDLVKFLSGERSKRQEKQGAGNVSIARLVEWVRDEAERKKALQRAELQTQEDEAEVKRLEEISDTKARILGISKSELLHG
jgi:hypothetical protein